MPNYTMLLKTLLLFISISLVSFGELVLAQDAITTYKKTIDDINCKAIKLLLVGYDRPVAARNIKTCTYSDIIQEVNKIKENQIKGYKADFLNLAKALNSYKTKITDATNYVEYESNLEEISAYSVGQFRNICQKHQTPSNTICQRLSEKVMTLESDLNAMVDKSLSRIQSAIQSGATGEVAVAQPIQRVAESPENEEIVQEDLTDILPAPPAVATEIQQTQPTSESTNSTTSWWVYLVILLLVAAITWLFKQNSELKEEVEDVKMLLKILTRNK